MTTGLFIRGRWDTLSNNGWCYTGLPSRHFGGPFVFRFPIADRLTAYEWALLAKKPLTAGGRYTVEVIGKLDGQDFTRRWSFTVARA